MPSESEIGPVYDTVGVQVLLGAVSEQAVDVRRQEHTLLALRTADDVWVYPAFQFTGRDVDPKLVPAIDAFRNVSSWAAALWFLTPNPDLGDVTPLEWALTALPSEALAASAQRTVHEWR